MVQSRQRVPHEAPKRHTHSFSFFLLFLFLPTCPPKAFQTDSGSTWSDILAKLQPNCRPHRRFHKDRGPAWGNLSAILTTLTQVFPESVWKTFGEQVGEVGT